MDFSEKIEVQGRHPVVVSDTRKEVHEDKLAVTFPSVAGLLPSSCLAFRATFNDDDGGCSTAGSC